MNGVGVMAQTSARNTKSGKGEFVKGQQGVKSCSFCGKSGHNIYIYIYMYGFPPHFKKGQGSTINNISFEDCDQEDKSSHEES